MGRRSYSGKNLSNKVKEYINIDELKPGWPLLDRKPRVPICILAMKDKKFDQISPTHLKDILEHSKRHCQFAMIASDTKLRAKETIRWLKPLFPKFQNYLNFCSTFNLISKISLFKNYTFYITSELTSTITTTPVKTNRRSSRRKTPPKTDLQSSIEKEDKHNDYEGLLRTLGAEITKNQPYPDDETVQAYALENIDKVMFTCLEQHQVCYYILYIGDKSSNT